MADLIGHRVGNYQLQRSLGEGGFAQVYLGEHIYLKTLAAIKILHRVTPQGMDNFMKEARTIAALNHPHILSVLDFGIDGGRPFLVMKYAPQGTLRSRHPHGAVLSLRRVVSYVRPIAAALKHAHDQKVLHRDIKPENILLDSQQSLLLSDFGIAAFAHSTKSMHTIDDAGTPYYMPPEQFQGHPCEASDQYALAVMVYEWLTGQWPFTGESFFAIGMQHTSAPVPSLREKNQDIPADVEQVVLTALKKQPKDRFATVSAFATALEQASQSTSTAPPSPSTSPPAIETTPSPMLSEPDKPNSQKSQLVQRSTNGSASHAEQKADKQQTEQLRIHELQQTLLPAILSIPNPRYRQVLLYLYIAGLSEQEVAQRLRIPVESVDHLREKALIVLNTKPEIMSALRSLPL